VRIRKREPTIDPDVNDSGLAKNRLADVAEKVSQIVEIQPGREMSRQAVLWDNVLKFQAIEGG
jgi:hypothetical protein